MQSPVKSYPDWKAPAEDGKVLVWPEPAEIFSQTNENQRRLSSAMDVRVQGVPLAELRRRARHWIGHVDDDQPLIANGHQTELYHPGVWAKDVLGHHLAEKLGGAAFHFAVDTDSPKHLHLRWHRGSAPLTDDASLTSAEWSGLLDAPSPAHLRELETRLPDAPLVKEFLGSLRRLALESPKLSPAMTNAMHELDWSLGLRHHALVCSPLWSSEPYLIYVHHLVADAAKFAAIYNAALREFRVAHKLRSSTRPMPDLAVKDHSIELPLWLDQLATGTRARARTLCRDGACVLKLDSGEEFIFNRAANGETAAAELGQWLRQNQIRLSPRALTLTMYLRVMVADQFIHGIGGGRYDQITDAIIARYFAIEAPSFSVTTATLYLPEAAANPRACVPCVEHDGHRLRHSVLGPQKRELVAQIAAAPRGSSQRQMAFYDMHRRLSEAAAAHPALRQWEQQLAETRTREVQDAALFDRELFYGLQTPQRLRELIEGYGKLVN